MVSVFFMTTMVPKLLLIVTQMPTKFRERTAMPYRFFVAISPIIFDEPYRKPAATFLELFGATMCTDIV